MTAIGELPIHVVYGEQQKDLSSVVVEGDGLALLGKDWFAHFHLDWSYLAYQSQSILPLEELLEKYQEVLPVTSSEVASAMQRDPLLSKVLHYTQTPRVGCSCTEGYASPCISPTRPLPSVGNSRGDTTEAPNSSLARAASGSWGDCVHDVIGTEFFGAWI